MPDLKYIALDTRTTEQARAGEPDAYGMPAERHISDGSGNPCRHCLADIAEGLPFLTLAYRPFPDKQAYAEIGPIFLHADACPRHEETGDLPRIFVDRSQVLVRGYTADHRIAYGTGRIVATQDLADAATKILADAAIAYVHVRSASNSCFQCRIDRG